MIDWTSFYAALYGTEVGLGVEAVITSATGDAAANVAIIDKVRGMVMDDASLIEIQGQRAACHVRLQELLAQDFALAQLDGGTITWNGKTWKIEAHREVSTPAEGVGEVVLHLCEDPEF